MRRIILTAALAVCLVPVGCVSWKDRADAKALEACQGKADPAERKLCRETVIETERARQQKLMDEQQLRIEESEERERLNEVFGDPKKD